MAKSGGRRMSTKKQRLIDAEKLKEEIIRMANRSSLGEVTTSTHLPLGTVLSLINDTPTVICRKVVKK